MHPTPRLVPKEPPHRLRQGFTLVELLVVIAIIGLLAAIIIPNILGALMESKKSVDLDNLRNLGEGYMRGIAKKGSRPATEGNRFWLSLYAGDDAAVEPGEYMAIGECPFMICPNGSVNTPTTLREALESAVASGGGGLASLAPELCDYAGPTRHTVTHESTWSTAIIGVTGVRPTGEGFFDQGFHIVKGSLSVRFVSYTEAEQEWGWPAALTAPDWTQAQMSTVRWDGP